MTIRLKRIREVPSPADGCRILVDRLWPRGVSRSRAAVDIWAKEIAPSTDLRKWFRHDPDRWDEFRHRYLAELREVEDALLEPVLAAMRAGDVTLLFDAKDEERNNAVVLREFLGNPK